MGTPSRAFALGQFEPEAGEQATVGRRGGDPFVVNTNPAIVFKDEEHDGTDRRMTPRLAACCNRLAAAVGLEWPGVQLRITEAFDANHEHGAGSLHYQGRAVDLTTAPIDGAKLGRLAALALEVGFDWVFYENALHVHASVKSEERLRAEKETEAEAEAAARRAATPPV